MKFKPYGEQFLDKDFKTALDELPIPYEPDNPEHIYQFEKFIATYGSHYTSKVVLGGKRVYTTSMTRKDVAELTRDSVDIKDTLSLDIQVS